MKDRQLYRKLECDFTQYYRADIRDLWDKDSKMTTRWVISHIENLPDESRIVRHFRDDDFTYNEHLLAAIVDGVRTTAFYSKMGAAAQVGKDFKKYTKYAPKPIPRPTVQPKKPEKPKFTPLKEAVQLLGPGIKIG